MNPIMLTMPTAPEPDARSRQAGPDDGKRQAAGSAFEGAIRSVNAGEKGPVRETAGREDRSRKTSDDAETTGEATPETSELAANAEKSADANTRLGDVLAFLTLSAKTETARAAEETGAGTGAIEGAPDGRENAAGDVAEARLDDKARMRLAVLRMETHFEPTMQTPVLVEAEAQAVAEALVEATEGLGEILVGLKKALDERGAGDVRRTGTVTGTGTATTGAIAVEADLKRTTASAVTETAIEAKHGERQAAHSTASSIVADLASAAKVQARQQNDGVRTAFLAAREADRPSLVVPATNADTIVPTMSAQVAASVIDALPAPDAPAAANAPRAPVEAELRMRAGGAALKTLTIQLQPEHLGVLDISMRLVDGQLSLELSADKADTARLLLEDRAGLKSLLEKAGFSLDDASITVVAREASMNASGRGPDAGGERPAAGGRREDTGGQGSERSFGERRDDQPARRNSGGAEAPKQRSGSSVFL